MTATGWFPSVPRWWPDPGPICRSSATATCATARCEAAETLAQDGIQAEVVDLRTLRPLDTETILASVAKTGRALVVHEANQFGGFGGEVAALIAEDGFDSLDAPVTRLAGPEVPGVPYAPRPGGVVHAQSGAHRRSRAAARRVLIG